MTENPSPAAAVVSDASGTLAAIAASGVDVASVAAVVRSDTPAPAPADPIHAALLNFETRLSQIENVLNIGVSALVDIAPSLAPAASRFDAIESALSDLAPPANSAVPVLEKLAKELFPKG